MFNIKYIDYEYLQLKIICYIGNNVFLYFGIGVVGIVVVGGLVGVIVVGFFGVKLKFEIEI